MGSDVETLYAAFLRQSPPDVVSAREALARRADALVQQYLDQRGVEDAGDETPSNGCGYPSGHGSAPSLDSDEQPPAHSRSATRARTEPARMVSSSSVDSDPPPPQKCRSAMIPDAQRAYEDSPKAAQFLDLDVIIAGSAFRVVWFLGVQMVLSRLEAAGLLRVHRYAGSSSGGKAAFQLLLTGEDSTVERYLSYGTLWNSMGRFKTVATLASSHDKLCKMEVEHMVDSYTEQLSALDDRLAISVTKLFPTPSRKLYTLFSDRPDVTKQVYRSTGLVYSTCDGFTAGDGGMVPSGVAPRYEDQVRDQLIVFPAFTDVPFTVTYTLEQGREAIELGQDEGLRFLTKAIEEKWCGTGSMTASLSIERPKRNLIL